MHSRCEYFLYICVLHFLVIKVFRYTYRYKELCFCTSLNQPPINNMRSHMLGSQQKLQFRLRFCSLLPLSLFKVLANGKILNSIVCLKKSNTNFLILNITSNGPLKVVSLF